MIEFLLALLPLATLIYKEYVSKAAAAQAAGQKFALDQAAMKAIVDQAVSDWNAQNSEASRGAGSAWDAADQDKPDPKF